jgi:hypothetical protein
MLISSDGITWRSIPFVNAYYESICWSAELGIFCGVGGGNIMTSLVPFK